MSIDIRERRKINSWRLDIRKPLDNRLHQWVVKIPHKKFAPTMKNALELSLDLNPDLNVGRIIIPGERNPGLFFPYEGDADLTLKFSVPTITNRESRIKRVVELVEKVHGNMGTLRSTQVLAHIILEWELQL